jgi:hypothetical protein
LLYLLFAEREFARQCGLDCASSDRPGRVSAGCTVKEAQGRAGLLAMPGGDKWRPGVPASRPCGMPARLRHNYGTGPGSGSSRLPSVPACRCRSRDCVPARCDPQYRGHNNDNRPRAPLPSVTSVHIFFIPLGIALPYAVGVTIATVLPSKRTNSHRR